QLLPNLPEDLQREILQWAAVISPESGVSLRQVSKAVQSCVEPILYHVVVCHYSQHWPPGLTLETFGRYAPRVQHLLIGFDSAQDRSRKPSLNECIFKHLHLCTNVTNLAIWTTHNTNLVEYCGHLRPTRLSVLTDVLFESTHIGLRGVADHPIFSRVTHLEIFDLKQKWEDWKDIVDLPHLTHLSVHEIAGDEIVGGVIRECHRLKAIALLSDPIAGVLSPRAPYLEKVPPYMDPRVVSFMWDPMDDWHAHAKGRKDMWAFADELIAARKRT
ncbi:hypothetical protein BDN72DRAFT_845768, partial [Pluteus cervinus]